MRSAHLCLAVLGQSLVGRRNGVSLLDTDKSIKAGMEVGERGGEREPYLVSLRLTRSHLVSLGFIRFRLDAHGFRGPHMVSLGLTLSQLISRGFT